MNSNRKGKVGERELAKILREYGYDCRRTQQYAGKVEDSADIVGLPYIHIECKRVQALNIDNAMSQAIRDCQDRLPTVFHRKNNSPWLVTMRLQDWITVYNIFYGELYLQDKERNKEGV